MKKFFTFLFSLTFLFGMQLSAQEAPSAETEGGEASFNPGSTIIGHVTDAHSWHMFDYFDKAGNEHAVAIPLPVILINDGHLDVFMSSKFHHGHADYKGYRLVGGGIEKDNPLGYFSFKASSIKTSLDAAAKSPAEVVFTKNLEMKDVRIPIWKSGNDIHIVLDAADAEAQSYMYEDYKNNQAAGNDFVNTFSFYRFGFR